MGLHHAPFGPRHGEFLGLPVSDPVRLLTKLCTSLMLHMSCRDDRIAWMTALTHARLPGSNLAAFPVDSSQIANGVTAVLPTNGTTSEPAVAALANTVTDLQTCADVALQPATLRLMATLQQQLRQVAAVLEEREDQIRQLMDERRQLQTELVAESQGLDGLAVWPTSQLWCLSAATDLFLCRQQHCTPSQRLHHCPYLSVGCSLCKVLDPSSILSFPESIAS